MNKPVDVIGILDTWIKKPWIGGESLKDLIRARKAAKELIEDLRRIEKHHVAQNRLKGRDESKSKTLRIVSRALARVTAE